MSARFASFVVAGLSSLAAASAAAEPMDPAIERLVSNASECRDALGRIRVGAAGAVRCTPDNAAFAKLVNQFGFAFAPTALHAARTTGFGGFHLALEASFTKISSGADYWKRGTEGAADPSTNTARPENANPSGVLTLYSLKLRKSFGFGFEVTGVVGFMPKTSIINGGGDARWALLEGFRTGAIGILPDLSVGGGVRTISGTPELQLTVVGVDAQISKPLTLADSSILTPWLGFQYLWIFGDSGIVDQTPATDALGYCGFAGNNVPGNADPKKVGADGTQIYDGQPVCRGAGSNPQADLNNNVVFDHVRLKRQRLLVGLNYRYEMLLAGAEFITDLVPPANAQSGTAKDYLKNEDRQWTMAFELGAMF
jgi:hypothetical protein